LNSFKKRIEIEKSFIVGLARLKTKRGKSIVGVKKKSVKMYPGPQEHFS
jgi:hypothetical protein